MGNTSSASLETDVQQIAETCIFEKDYYRDRMKVIFETHKLLQVFATLLLQERIPTQLPDYKNFSDISEEYFNTRRKDVIPELTSINPKIKNYYDFYNALEKLPTEYERADSESKRRAKLTDVFNIMYTMLQLLVKELHELCDMQGRPVTENVYTDNSIIAPESNSENASTNT